MGVIGAEFGQDVSLDTKHPHLQARAHHREGERRKSSVVEGFGIGNNNLARHTSEFFILFSTVVQSILKKKFNPRFSIEKFQLEQENRNFGQSSSVFMTNPDLNF